MSVLIPSFKSNVPSFAPKELGKHDIAIKFAGSWLLVGEMAQIENSLAERMQHGDFSSLDVQLMAKAATAKAIGKSGVIETDVAIAAPLKSINQFRVKAGQIRLKDEQLDYLQSALSEIEYMDDTTDGEPKILKVKVKNGNVVNELAAVLEVIPSCFVKFGLIQWGHGDLQMVSVNEGTVVGEPYCTHGLWSAVRQFQKIADLQPAEAQKAFKELSRFNGNMSAKVSCEQEVSQAIQHHIITDMSPVLNNLAKQNQKNIIVSGGTAHNKIAMDLLRTECKGRSMNVYSISELEGVEVDPVFTCLEGLKKFGSLRLDIGHSSLKAHMEV